MGPRPLCALFVAAAACAPAGLSRPASLRGHQILIESHDSLSDQVAARLRRKGFTVRGRIRGGSSPTAALIAFTVRDLAAPGTEWYHAWLADTRTGAVVAAVAIPLDSMGGTPEAAARVVVDSLVAQLASHRPLPPP